MIDLSSFVSDFSLCLKLVDAQHPQAINIRSKEAFQPGIGPFSEAQAVRLITTEMERHYPSRYAKKIKTGTPYPETPRQKCDLCIGEGGHWQLAVEIKLLRFLGDNGKLNDNMLMHILSPYPEHRSAVSDCLKLRSTSLGDLKAIMIYGFDNVEWPLDPAIEAFEILAGNRVKLGPRITAPFTDLIHPIHSQGAVYAWQVV
jgi:hypothetical protein